MTFLKFKYHLPNFFNCQQVPEEVDRVMVGIEAYMSIRRHVSDAGCSPFEHIGDRSQNDGGEVCFLSLCLVST